jgi:hypothetical protein
MEDLKEKLICGFKNSEVKADNYGNLSVKDFIIRSHGGFIYKEETVMIKTWYGKTKEKTISKRVPSPTIYKLWHKCLEVELTEEEYNDLKSHLKDKWEQQVTEDLEKICK